MFEKMIRSKKDVGRREAMYKVVAVAQNGDRVSPIVANDGLRVTYATYEQACRGEFEFVRPAIGKLFLFPSRGEAIFFTNALLSFPRWEQVEIWEVEAMGLSYLDRKARSNSPNDIRRFWLADKKAAKYTNPQYSADAVCFRACVEVMT